MITWEPKKDFTFNADMVSVFSRMARRHQARQLLERLRREYQKLSPAERNAVREALLEKTNAR